MFKKISFIIITIIMLTCITLPCSAAEWDNIIGDASLDEIIVDLNSSAIYYGHFVGSQKSTPTWLDEFPSDWISPTDGIELPILDFVPTTLDMFYKVVITLGLNNIPNVLNYYKFEDEQTYILEFKLAVYGKNIYDWGMQKPNALYLICDNKNITPDFEYNQENGYGFYTISTKITGADLKELRSIYLSVQLPDNSSVVITSDYRLAVVDGGITLKKYTEANEIIDKEKEEAKSQGNESIDEMTNAIPDNSAGFLDSLGNLVEAVSYTGTDCNINFPGIKTPAFESLGIQEHTILEEKDINITGALEMMPSTIILLVQSLVTVLLVVYAVKSVYGMVEYVISLRQNSTNSGGGEE